MTTEFRKDLSHLTWEEVFARQQQRATLLPAWLDSLHVQEGDHVLDLEAGPGYVSLQLAKCVGASGLVYAIGRSAEALSYLQGQMRQNAVTNIRCVMTDVLALSLDEKRISSALLSMMLHHADDPATLIKKVAELLPRSAWAVIAEFHPDSPASSGPPCEACLSPGKITQWCQEAGLQVVHYARQSDEHYMLTVQRSPHDKSASYVVCRL